MNVLHGFALLLLCQSAGELLSRGAGIGLPGPVIGMFVLLLVLRLPALRPAVGAAAEVLLSHLSLLFVPVGVGVIAHLSLVSQYGLRLLVVVVVSTWLGLAVTALLLRRLWPGGSAPGATSEAA